MFLEYTGKLFRWIEHNQGLVVAGALCLFLAGCDSLFPVTTPSPTTGQPATIDELQQQLNTAYRERDKQATALQQQADNALSALKAFNIETDSLEQSFQNAAETIETKQQQRYAVLEMISGIAQNSGVPMAPTIATTLLAGGAIWDNRRKNLTIRTLKNGSQT